MDLKMIVLLIILSIITYTDIKRREIDHWPLVIGLLFIIPYTVFGFNNVSFKESLVGFLIAFITFMILGFFGMGGGDIKLMALIGLFLGWKMVIIAMYLTFLIGAIIGVLSILIKKSKSKDFIPLGPSIAIATMLTAYYGEIWVNTWGFLYVLR